ncbi:hypothetical protein D3C76_1250550 [compost metagenome]
MAVARRSLSAPSMSVTLPFTAFMSVIGPVKGTPPLPGACQLPVVPVTVPLLDETTPWPMARSGSAMEVMTVTSELLSWVLLRVVTWLDCASTSRVR